MKKTCKNILLSLCAISLLAGCASKDVEFDSNEDKAKTEAKKDQNKVDSKAEQIQGQESAIEGSVDESTTQTQSELTQINSNGEINIIESDVNGQTVVLESVHFAFDKFNLSDDMREIATSNAGKVNTVTADYSNLKIKLEGNCDEWGTDEYNYALGLKRAKTAKDALVADGVNAEKIVMVSFGESNPVCTERNVKCWKMNRRVDYRLLP